MYYNIKDPVATMANYRLEGKTIGYNDFIPKLYNLCKSLGFEAGKITPSRAFCSDENQGYPVILITKHFGTFPFNHGRVGGVVATGRHGPHAHHGQDMVIIQASHVGYDPVTESFGVYKRLQTQSQNLSSSCGKIENVLSWYENEYCLAQENIKISCEDGVWTITIDNQLLNETRDEGLTLNIDKLVSPNDQGQPANSTSKCFSLSSDLVKQFEQNDANKNEPQSLEILPPEYYYFKKHITGDEQSRNHVEYNLFPVMPWVLASKSPLLAAAKVNTQVEFDRAYRSIQVEENYRNKRIFFIAGLNIDISPEVGHLFPATKFVPWAAYVQQADGTHIILEQDELHSKLQTQNTTNPDQIDLENAIRLMSETKEIRIPSD